MFNSKIGGPRNKPILGLMEGLKDYCMKRMQLARERPSKWNSKLITPSAAEKLEILKVDSRCCIPLYAGYKRYQVTEMYGAQFAVDLDTKECTCRKWQLSGIPCPHAICAIFNQQEDPINYVHEWYHVETYAQTYKSVINPMPSSEYWIDQNLPEILPPTYTVKAGRPQKVRKRSRGEVEAIGDPTRMKRAPYKVRCKRCGESGHNKRGCKKKDGENATTKNSNPTTSERGKHPVRNMFSFFIICYLFFIVLLNS